MPPSNEPSDQDLIRRVLLETSPHAQLAFTLLVKRHQSRLRLYLRGLCGHQGIADELAQETFLKAYRALGQFKHEANFKTWLIAIARNTFMDQARLMKHRLESATVPTQASDDSAASPHIERAAQSHDAGMLSLDMEKAIQALREDERSVILHCYFADLSMVETAAALNMPLGTVKTHASRALAKMRQTLNDWETP
jgi:RNA polymerase sigma factor (sigma-70 family)